MNKQHKRKKHIKFIKSKEICQEIQNTKQLNKISKWLKKCLYTDFKKLGIYVFMFADCINYVNRWNKNRFERITN